MGAGWLVSAVMIAMLAAFNLYCMDALVRIRRDIVVIRRAVTGGGKAAAGGGAAAAEAFTDRADKGGGEGAGSDASDSDDEERDGAREAYRDGRGDGGRRAARAREPAWRRRASARDARNPVAAVFRSLGLV